MVSTTIQMPEDLMAKIEETAAAQHRSPNELVHDAVERYLGQQRREKLFAYGDSRARELDIREDQVPDLVHEVRREVEHGR